MTSIPAFTHTISATVNVNDADSTIAESITLRNASDLPRVAQHNIMMAAITAWQGGLPKDLYSVTAWPEESGKGWALFNVTRHRRSYEIPKDGK